MLKKFRVYSVCGNVIAVINVDDEDVNNYVNYCTLFNEVYKPKYKITEKIDQYMVLNIDKITCIDWCNYNIDLISIFNTDLSEAKFCLNGYLCVYKYMLDTGFLYYLQPVSFNGFKFSVEKTCIKKLQPYFTYYHVVNFNNYDNDRIELSYEEIKRDNEKEFEYDVDLINKHKIIISKDIYENSDVFVENLGERDYNLCIARYISKFNYLDDGSYNYWVEPKFYELGAGLTKSCGSGSCALALVSGLVENKRNISLEFGNPYIYENGKSYCFVSGVGSLPNFEYKANIADLHKGVKLTFNDQSDEAIQLLFNLISFWYLQIPNEELKYEILLFCNEKGIIFEMVDELMIYEDFTSFSKPPCIRFCKDFFKLIYKFCERKTVSEEFYKWFYVFRNCYNCYSEGYERGFLNGCESKNIRI